MRIVKFGAPWCGPCKFQDKILNELVDEGYDVEFVNVDEHEELANKYGILNVPAMIIFDDEENEVHRFIGLTQKKDLLEVLS